MDTINSYFSKRKYTISWILAGFFAGHIDVSTMTKCKALHCFSRSSKQIVKDIECLKNDHVTGYICELDAESTILSTVEEVLMRSKSSTHVSAVLESTTSQLHLHKTLDKSKSWSAPGNTDSSNIGFIVWGSLSTAAFIICFIILIVVCIYRHTPLRNKRPETYKELAIRNDSRDQVYALPTYQTH